MSSLVEFLAQVLGALDQAGIPHMISGSVASTHYGEPRTTQDVDLIIDPTEQSLRLFLEYIDGERFYVNDVERAYRERSSFNVIDSSSGWKMDMNVLRLRPFSQSEFARRVGVELEGLEVFISTPEDTIISKLEWAKESGSDRQIRDVAGMLRSLGTKLDSTYLDNWVRDLDLADELQLARDFAG